MGRRRIAFAATLAILFARAPFAREGPVIWYEDDRTGVPMPREREPNLSWDGFEESVARPFGRLTHPGRIVRGLGALFGGDHVPPAANVNSLDEVPNSTWFTNRIGLFPVAPEDAALGPGEGTGPSREGPWTLVRAKSDGVTPGFTIRDARGDVHFLKFDPPGIPNIATAAGVISSKILHLAGYNVPDEAIVTFTRADVALGPGVRVTAADGTKRAMTAEDLDAVLGGVDRSADGSWRAIASRLLPGTPIGPFDYQGRRGDDPNDRVDHENRRELRGLRLFAAWLAHFDTKQHNSLDVYVEEGARGYVRHYLIDFASTLGTGANSVDPRPAWEYTLDPPAIAGRLAAFGLHEDAWRRLRRPEGLPEIGYFESELFDPEEFKPLEPNSAFANLTDRDGYWAAKIITAFRDEHLRAIVQAGRYRDPEATATMARVLAARRDKIGRVWFDRIPPLDFFRVVGGRLAARDLGQERGLYPGTAPRYRGRAAAAAGDGTEAAGAWSPWVTSTAPEFTLDAPPGEQGAGRVVECAVDRGRGWSRAVRVRVDTARGIVTAVER